ncbi:MAG: ABC transporter substrate-binding protein, partial [Salinigranum sp.]
APLGNKDFSSQMTAAKNSGADVVYLQNFGADQANSLKQAHEFGLGKEMDIYVGLTTATIAQRAGQDQWENVYAGIQYYHSADNSGTKKFSQAMQDKFDYPGDSYAAVCYTGVKEFARAIKNQQSLDVKDISSYLEKNTGFQYTKTKENWRACDNQAVQDWYIVKGKSPSNIDNEWDIFEAADNVGGRDLLLKCSEY